MNTRHRPAPVAQSPIVLTLCPKSAHAYQNKELANQNCEFLSPLFSHCCALLRLQPLCFDTLHKNTRGWEVPPAATVPSRIGREDKKDPRTGLKTGHYRAKAPASEGGRYRPKSTDKSVCATKPRHRTFKASRFPVLPNTAHPQNIVARAPSCDLHYISVGVPPQPPCSPDRIGAARSARQRCVPFAGPPHVTGTSHLHAPCRQEE